MQTVSLKCANCGAILPISKDISEMACGYSAEPGSSSNVKAAQSHCISLKV